MPSKAETDTFEPMVAAEAVSCVELLDRRVGCAMGVAAARLLRSLCRPRWVWKKPKRKRCQRQAKSTRGQYSLQQWRRRQKQERRISPGKQKAVNSYTWLVCAKIVKCGRGEREPTQGSMFSVGREPTQDRAFGEGFESTQSSAFGVGHEPTQDSAVGEGRESTQTDPWVLPPLRSHP